jgi:ATP synthase protein I
MEVNEKNTENEFSREIAEKVKRKLKAQLENKRSVWSGFGLFGIVGWSVVAPTLLGAALGNWLDTNYPQSFSWILSLLLIGIIAGCATAWHWIKKEHTDMNQNN